MKIRLEAAGAIALGAWLLCAASDASGQVIETVGIRAQGMGGAFVAVANDSTASWWNPGGLAAGPFVDLSLADGRIDQDDALPGSRDRASWFALGTPALGISYYRLRLTDVRPQEATDPADPGREEVTAGALLRSLTVRQLGGTVVYTVLPGVHVGANLKWVWGEGGTAVGAPDGSPGGWLDDAEDLEGGKTAHHFDVDAGVLATAGVLRLGAVVRNLREPTFGAHTWQLPRQYRVGMALDFAAVGGVPLTVAADVDLRIYRIGERKRQMLAVGAEQWLFGRRLGLRGGARFNQTGDNARIVTGGASVAVRAGTFIEAHVVRGRDAEERGWGAGARVSF